MPRYDFRTPRIYLNIPLVAGHAVPLDRFQANYLLNVLRLENGDGVLLFNGKDGEWQAVLAGKGKKTLAAEVHVQSRPQPQPSDLHFLFAPLKHARLDYMVQKAVELGVSKIQPVMTKHTQVSRLNLDRMYANAIEAAQQCGVLSVPEVVEQVPFKSILSGDDGRLLVFCDEDAEVRDPIAALAALPKQPLAVLIGPEGGFAVEEREALMQRPNVVRISLGPLILRADTAAVSALTLVQAVLGNWK